MAKTANYEQGRHRLTYRLGTIDREVIAEVIEHDAYRLRCTDLPADGVVVDIGGHIGSFSIAVAVRHPGVRVFSLEMAYDNYDLLSRNTAPYRNIGVAWSAVIGRRAPIGFVRRSGNTGGHFLVWGGRSPTDRVHRTLTFAAVLAAAKTTRVDLLKLDCEGAEHEIVRAALADGSLRGVQRIAAEYHNFHGEHGGLLAESLRGAGFEVEQVVFDATSGMLFAARSPLTVPHC